MRTWRLRRLGFACLALHLAACPWPAAEAADPDRLLFIRAEDQRTVLFGQIDAGRSVFLSAGSKQTLTGPLDRTGFVTMEASGFGITRERVSGPQGELPATRFVTQTSVVVGHQWSFDKLFLAGFLGPEILHEQLTVAGQVYRFSEPRYGAKAQLELWAHPTRDTLLTATIVGSTSNRSLWTRGSAGVRVWADLFAGPEVTAYATQTYQETKLGAHLTGFRLGLVQGRLSGGWMFTDDGRPGAPYLSLAAWIRM
ncbi:cellulose biosynthesis protein BcsS [Enterovirga aerilata]|uniref:Cellulose biosynthesis protein BcsS n=1 Tax=Enterovirga aerilata TaxID=2730920 RepID=A0A849I7U5_9HYPH|nr:cellulose biosynthesis protein BcsS [Enterovirga sp. DB1703]NNM73381.1 cellulose biosynthesis protein BcsS [Enterovirga sp. DB1703]